MRNFAAACFLAALFASGCYTYAPPDPALTARNFLRPPSAEGETLLRQEPELSLATAIEIALVNNPTLTQALHAANAARMRYYQALGAYAPELKGTFQLHYQPQHYGTLQNPIPDTATNEHHLNLSVGVQASWLLFDGLVREFNVLAAKSGAKQAASREEDVRRLLKRAVAYAYCDIILAQERRRIYLSDTEFQEANLQYAESRLKFGGASLNEVLNFRILAAAARTRLLQSEYQFAVSRYALSALLGYPAGTLPSEVRFPALERSTPPYPIPLEEALARAVANRPDLAAAREASEIARYRKYASYGRYFPTVTATAGAAYLSQKAEYSGGFLYDNSLISGGQFSVGVVSEWLIFNGLSRYNAMRESQALYAAAQFAAAGEYLKVVEEVRAAYANFENLRAQSALYGDMMNWVFVQRKLVESEYRAGHVVVTRLNEAQNDLVSAESGYVESLAAYRKSRAALAAAISGD